VDCGLYVPDVTGDISEKMDGHFHTLKVNADR
jgi:hypothetical protein